MTTESFTLSMTPDSHGFLGRKCSACEFEFRVPGSVVESGTLNRCPHCPTNVQERYWFTDEQWSPVAEHTLAITSNLINREMSSLSVDAGHVRLRYVPGESRQPPESYQERDDPSLVATTFPCCGQVIRHAPVVAALSCPVCAAS